jgi:hypothetical protein
LAIVNLLILIGMGVAGYLLFWLIQSVMLAALGEQQAWPMRYESDSQVMRWTMKIAIQVIWIAMLVLFPLTQGQTVIEYYGDRFTPRRIDALLSGLGLVVLLYLPMMLVRVATGWVILRPIHGWRKSILKSLRSLLTPLPLALMEEAVFRGLLVEQCLVAWGDNTLAIVVTVALTSTAFSSVHFIRRLRADIPWCWPAIGLLLFGALLAVAYIVSGRSMWLPVGLHAGGILVTQSARPFVEYKGSGWLIGYRSFPMCGLTGIIAMIVVCVCVVLFFSGD